MQKERISVRLSEPVLARLDIEAKTRGITQAEAARDLITERLNQLDTKKEATPEHSLPVNKDISHDAPASPRDGND